jgi:hypothetical protein
MCCIAEIAMMVFGIMTLVKGKFSLSRNQVIVGAPAYAIGGILTATLPVVFAIGIVIGIAHVAKNGNQPLDPSEYAYLDLIIVPVVLLIVAMIAWAAPKRDARSPFGNREDAHVLDVKYQPMDPENPYASPTPPEDLK